MLREAGLGSVWLQSPTPTLQGGVCDQQTGVAATLESQLQYFSIMTMVFLLYGLTRILLCSHAWGSPSSSLNSAPLHTLAQPLRTTLKSGSCPNFSPIPLAWESGLHCNTSTCSCSLILHRQFPNKSLTVCTILTSASKRTQASTFLLLF